MSEIDIAKAARDDAFWTAYEYLAAAAPNSQVRADVAGRIIQALGEELARDGLDRLRQIASDSIARMLLTGEIKAELPSEFSVRRSAIDQALQEAANIWHGQS